MNESMLVDQFEPQFRRLGLPSDMPRCLLLAPMVGVARHLTSTNPDAIERLLQQAVHDAGLEPRALELARSWLRSELAEGDLALALATLRQLSQAPDEPMITVSDVVLGVSWAYSAAELDRDRDGHVSESTVRALGAVSEQLGVDLGQPWAEVMAEIGEPLPSGSDAELPQLKSPPQKAADRGGSRKRVPLRRAQLTTIKHDNIEKGVEPRGGIV